MDRTFVSRKKVALPFDNHPAFRLYKEKKMFGKTVMGIERSTFLIDEKGKLVKEIRKVKAKGHIDELLEHLQG